MTQRILGCFWVEVVTKRGVIYMNYKTRVLTEEQMFLFIRTIKDGYVRISGKQVRGNKKVAFALSLMANTGLRVSDVVNLRLSDIIRDGNRYRLDIIEQKTRKKREFTVADEMYRYIQSYALEMGINPRQKLVGLTTRTIQEHIKEAREYLDIEGVSSHSFRKYFATSVYESNDYNVELVRVLLQHSDLSTTQKYLGVQRKQIEDALHKHIKLIN